MATAFNSLVDYGATPYPGPLPTDSNGGATQGAVMGPNLTNTQSAAAVQGTSPLTGIHNVPLHVAFLGILALVVIILLRRAGFRFGGAVGVSFGGR